MSAATAVPPDTPAAPRSAAAWEVAAALLIGLACFAVVLGPAVLDPRNIAWLQTRDPAAYYLGWSFFRASPWAWPPALNPGYGLEISSTIFFADLVPIMALALKATIAPPDGPWQYHGAWLMACFALQAYFAHRLSTLYLGDPVARLLVAALACFSPVLLWRLSGPHAATGHYALAGQWLLLWAGWLCLRVPGRRQMPAWVAVGALAALVHSYLLAMVLALWLADTVRRRMLGQRAAALAAEGLAVAAVVAGALWLGGFRTMPDGGLAAGGFGVFRANLLTLLDPQEAWSFVIPPKPRGAGDYEGFGFIGTGGVALLLAALWMVRREARPPIPATYRPFLATVLGLALFSLSNRIALGSLVLVTIPLPEALERAASLFRSSGRMIWPLHYLVLLGAAFVACRRTGRAGGRIALAAALLLQVGDGAAGWLPIAREARIQGTAWTTHLQDPFWDQAARRYARIRHLPPGNATPHWKELSYLAVSHGIPTDAAYLARVDAAALARLRAQGEATLRSGRFEADTLYVLHGDLACRIAAAIDPRRDLLMRLDGIDVLAMGWLATAEAPAAGQVIHADAAAGRGGLSCSPGADGTPVTTPPGD